MKWRINSKYLGSKLLWNNTDHFFLNTGHLFKSRMEVSLIWKHQFEVWRSLEKTVWSQSIIHIDKIVNSISSSLRAYPPFISIHYSSWLNCTESLIIMQRRSRNGREPWQPMDSKLNILISKNFKSLVTQFLKSQFYFYKTSLLFIFMNIPFSSSFFLTIRWNFAILHIFIFFIEPTGRFLHISSPTFGFICIFLSEESGGISTNWALLKFQVEIKVIRCRKQYDCLVISSNTSFFLIFLQKINVFFITSTFLNRRNIG